MGPIFREKILVARRLLQFGVFRPELVKDVETRIDVLRQREELFVS
jgi:hypothetical protein